MKISLTQKDCKQIKELEEVRRLNEEVLEMCANYIRNDARFITKDLMQKLIQETGVTEEEAYLLLFTSACDLSLEDNKRHREVARDYFKAAIKKLDIKVYKDNPYYKNIKMPEVREGKWQFKYEIYEPYEAFIYKDILVKEDFREIPCLGFFDESFSFPAVLESGVEWMMITPEELETQQGAIDEVKGKVVTFGLGLGYFTYMVSEKEEVEQIAVIERDSSIIRLFKEYILPQFPHKEKVEIIQMDALEYTKNEMPKMGYDYAFVDLWHDVSDGIDLYLQMKKLEQFNPKTRYLYWIEDSILSNLRFCVLEVLLEQFTMHQENALIEAMEQMSAFKMPENSYEQKHRGRLEKILDYFKDKQITSYEEFIGYLENDYLRKVAKII